MIKSDDEALAELIEMLDVCSFTLACKTIGISFERGKKLVETHGIKYQKHKLLPTHERGKQANTLGKSKHIYNGEPITVWAKRLGVSHKTIRSRLSEGWSLERACTTPKIKPGQPCNVKFLHSAGAIANREKLKKLWSNMGR